MVLMRIYLKIADPAPTQDAITVDQPAAKGDGPRFCQPKTTACTRHQGFVGMTRVPARLVPALG
jgi:hypothetical protein